MSAGARKPFFVVADEREPIENRPFAFGADATRRRKREADAETDLGLNGPFVRDLEGVVGVGNEGWDGSAVKGLFLDGVVGAKDCFRAFGLARSDFVCCRDRPGAVSGIKLRVVALDENKFYSTFMWLTLV